MPDYDWLPRLQAEGMRVANDRARLQLAQRELQMRQQQNQVQAMHWWAEQARLKRQEEFQNRKFLFEVAKDQRDSEREGILADRRFALEENRYGLDERRVATGERSLNWQMDPQNPSNLYEGARAAEIRDELGEETSEPWRVTTYWAGETGTPDDYRNAFGKSLNNGLLTPNSLALSSDLEKEVTAKGVKPGDWLNLRLGTGEVVRRQWDDRTRGDLRGRFDLYGPNGPDKRDGAAVVAWKPDDDVTDWSYAPQTGRSNRYGLENPPPPFSLPGQEGVVASPMPRNVDRRGRVTDWGYVTPRERAPGILPEDRQLDSLREQLTTRKSAMAEVPEVEDDRDTAATSRREEALARNARLMDEQMQILGEMDRVEFRKRLKTSAVTFDNLSPELMTDIQGAIRTGIETGDPASLQNVRQKLAMRATAGDEAAGAALTKVNALLGPLAQQSNQAPEMPDLTSRINERIEDLRGGK